MGGQILEKKEIARRLLSRGKATIEEIAEDAYLPVEEVEALRNYGD